MPDLHVHNFPAGRQRVDNSGAHCTAEAFFEVKTYTVCNSRCSKNNRIMKPPDRRAKEILSKYNNKFRKLDRAFEEDVVGNGETDVMWPFQTAQGRFYWGQVIPMCAGWFGEI